MGKDIRLITELACQGVEKYIIEFKNIYYNDILNFVRISTIDEKEVLEYTNLIMNTIEQALPSLSEEQFDSTDVWIMMVAKNKLEELQKEKLNIQNNRIVTEIMTQSYDDYDIIENSDLEISYEYLKKDECRDFLCSVFSQLSVTYKQVLELYYKNNMSTIKIAEILDASVDHIKIKLMLARKEISSELKEYEITHNVDTSMNVSLREFINSI